MLELRTSESFIKIDVLNFHSVDDIECEIRIEYIRFSSAGHIKIGSCWFYWSGIQKFYNSLCSLMQGEEILADIGDMSDEFKLTIRKSDLGVVIMVNYNRSSELAFYLELNADFDIVNITIRQIADFIREAKVHS